MSRLLEDKDRVVYDYVMEHLGHVGLKHRANRIDFHMDVDDEIRFQVYMQLEDGREFQLQAKDLNELMYKIYGENEVPSL